MQLILVRHGRPASASPTPQDPPLGEEGKAQAGALARCLANESIQRIVCSPLSRARETAQVLAQTMGSEPEVIDGLAEADRYATTYRSVEEMRQLPADQWAAFMRDPVSFLGADPVLFRQAVLSAFDGILQSAPHQRVAVFTHGVPINLLLSHVLKLDRLTHFVPHYCSITRLTGTSLETLQILSINETLHLRQEPS